ncbi:Glutamate--tRNA ligase mitochondrial, partial [Coemansia sp. Cherry 401B]
RAQLELADSLGEQASSVDFSTVQTALQLAGDRLTFTKDLYAAVPFIFADPALDTPAATEALQKVPTANRVRILEAAERLIAAEQPQVWTGFAKSVASAAQVPNRQAMLMLRFALTGQPSGPKIPELLGALSADASS